MINPWNKGGEGVLYYKYRKGEGKAKFSGKGCN